MRLRTLCLIVGALAVTPDLSSNDHYKVLGLSPQATLKDVKSAYRSLALEYHPDKNSSPEAPAKFQKVAEAYEVLSDKDARARYDAGSKGGFAGGARGFKGFSRFKHKTAQDTFRSLPGTRTLVLPYRTPSSSPSSSPLRD